MKTKILKDYVTAKERLNFKSNYFTNLLKKKKFKKDVEIIEVKVGAF